MGCFQKNRVWGLWVGFVQKRTRSMACLIFLHFISSFPHLTHLAAHQDAMKPLLLCFYAPFSFLSYIPSVMALLASSTRNMTGIIALSEILCAPTLNDLIRFPFRLIQLHRR
ncbi:hypothetical protein CSPX01_15524 [Colletotrichum filicis]|nr:hypothetical protein CSPX01_15524 [Colletotrichum filicis]